MAFWGMEIKPGKPYTHIHDPSVGRLRITQATVGSGSSTKNVLLQCNVGKKSPVLLCSLIPDKAESCCLDLEFEEEDDVMFSVIGPRSIHLAGYNSCHGRAGGEDGDTDSYGEDIGETETDESGSFDSEDEYEDDFIDDGGMEMYDSDPSPRPNSGVVIEEIIEDDKQGSGANNCHSSKKIRVEGSDDRPKSDRQIVVKRNLQKDSESEDEDGFPIFSSRKHKSSAESNGAEKDIARGNLSQEKLNEDTRAVSDSTGKNQEQQHEKTDKSSTEKIEKTPNKKEKLKKRKKNKIEKAVVESEENILAYKSKDDASKDETECDDKEANALDMNPVDIEEERDHTTEKEAGTLPNIDETAETKASKNKLKKKRSKEKISGETEGTVRINENGGDNIQDTDDRGAKKRKKSKKSKEVAANVHEGDANKKTLPIVEMEQDAQPQKTRTFSNGLIVEEMQMGKPDGKKATSGKKVSVNYIGKLKNGKIFDSNVGQRPFTFRLGVGQVIKGWDVGVNGMRIGDKRRLTIPPSMGYGSRGMGQIPANSWLVFDVELVDAK